MATFDPNKHKGGGYEALPAGTYLIAMISYERKQSKQGKPYLRAKFAVAAGRAKGKTFYSSVSIDMGNDGAMSRLSLYCQAVGVTEAFDLDSDRAIERALLGKPFGAQVTQEQSGQYVNNDIKRFVLELPPAMVQAGEAWWQDWINKHSDPAGDGDDWSADDFAGGGGSTSGGGFSDDDGFGGDPDIPF